MEFVEEENRKKHLERGTEGIPKKFQTVSPLNNLGLSEKEFKSYALFCSRGAPGAPPQSKIGLIPGFSVGGLPVLNTLRIQTF